MDKRQSKTAFIRWGLLSSGVWSLPCFLLRCGDDPIGGQAGWTFGGAFARPVRESPPQHLLQSTANGGWQRATTSSVLQARSGLPSWGGRALAPPLTRRIGAISDARATIPLYRLRTPH